MHIKQSRKIATKFTDPNPLSRVVFGTSGMGPATKNFARLNDPANALRRKDTIGRASECCQLVATRYPFWFTAKREEFNMRRANEMCA